MSNRDHASITEGLFYGSAAYIASYLIVYIQVIRHGNYREKIITAAFGSSAVSDSGASKLAELLFPSVWKYAGWLYHHSIGGSVGVTINLLPGSYGLNEEVVFPKTGSQVSKVRETAFQNPAELIDVIRTVEPVSVILLLAITPISLLICGAILAYRNNDITPIGGAIAGSKTMVGFLAASVVGTHLFAATISGLTLSTSGAVSAGAGFSLQIIEGSIGAEIGAGATVEPVITIGPSLGRAVLSGFIYPVIFGTLGGMLGSIAGLGKGILVRL